MQSLNFKKLNQKLHSYFAKLSEKEADQYTWPALPILEIIFKSLVQILFEGGEEVVPLLDIIRSCIVSFPANLMPQLYRNYLDNHVDRFSERANSLYHLFILEVLCELPSVQTKLSEHYKKLLAFF